jgi:hypothetical protein
MSEDGYTPKRIEEERRWKPTSLQRNPSINDEVEIKIRRARGILNKVGGKTIHRICGLKDEALVELVTLVGGRLLCCPFSSRLRGLRS